MVYTVWSEVMMQQPYCHNPAWGVSIFTVLKVQLGTSVLLTTTGFQHLIRCLVWLFCELSSHHIKYSLLLRSVTHSPTVSHSYGDDFISDFKQTNTNIHPPSREKLGGWRMFVELISHTSMRLKRWCQTVAPYTLLLSTETAELFITFSRLESCAGLVDVYTAARK